MQQNFYEKMDDVIITTLRSFIMKYLYLLLRGI